MEKRSGEGKRLGFRRLEGRTLPSSSSRSYRGSWRPSPCRSNETTGSEKENSPDRNTIEIGHDPPQDIPSLVGTCPDMCPAKERAQRERLRDLSLFERLSGNPGRTSSSLAVKKFCRTLSTTQVQASDIRPLPVLQDTLMYLFNLIDSPGHPFEEVHEFIFDRTRSIRQDLSMQTIVNEEAIHMYEEMVKFHIISHQRLLRCSGKSGVSSLLHLNMEQLMKSLVSLYDMYAHKTSSTSINKNKAEFYSFYVLLHLGSNSQGGSLAVWFRQLAFPILQSKEMQFARSVLRYFKIGNYKSFFSTISAEASFLQLCLLEPVVNEVRARAISYINYSGYKLHPYPLAHLSELLVIEVSDLDSLCNACGLETCTDEAGCKLLPTKQTGFCLPKGGFQSFSFLNSERLQRWEAICRNGGTLRDVVLFN